ncbi:hypothetical protein [Selenomonas caprae]|nr:hypothetical protein [Selenomonas caprae]
MLLPAAVDIMSFCNFFTELGLEEEKEELQQGKEYVFASIEID